MGDAVIPDMIPPHPLPSFLSPLQLLFSLFVPDSLLPLFHPAWPQGFWTVGCEHIPWQSERDCEMHLNHLLCLSVFFHPGEILPRNRGQFIRFCGLYSGEKLKLKHHYSCKHVKPPAPLSHLLKCLIHINLVVALPVLTLSHVGSGLARACVQIFCS